MIKRLLAPVALAAAAVALSAPAAQADAYDKEIVRMLLLGGALVEQPLEFGTPVSTIAGVSGLGGIQP
ncbi:hypothetical protein ACIPW5_36955 [Streptomyces sp. NPDC090077]|uniref:hypothetical protein n=1 Tax=Streptomyces sp. NPDC090077 TaxID=3365938 RepID=UPI00380B677C